MDFRRIGIAGAGTMGTSMARIFAEKGYAVTLWNRREKQTEVPAGVRFTTDLRDLADMDLVVENIAEDISVKQGFYRQLSEVIRDGAVVATNTSGLSITLLSESVSRPERFLGMHWLNPAHLIPLIEIICHEGTDPQVADAVYQLGLAIGKKTALVRKDVPGFAVNRLQLALVREALAMVKEGVISPEDLDGVVKYGLGFRWAVLGPLETMDLGGLDIFYRISEYLMPDLADSHEPPALLADAFLRGDLGAKSGRGFYDYSGDLAEQKKSERDRKLHRIYQALYGEEN